MQKKSPGRIRNTTIAASLLAALGSTTWSSASHACTMDPYISSLCIMAMASPYDFGQQFVKADGRNMAIAQNQALYALIGLTYGGDGKTGFLLPNLAGRVVVGAGTYINSNPSWSHTYRPGEVGGNPQMTAAQLPTHSHGLGASVAVSVNASTMGATTTLSGLTTTTNLANIPFTSSSSALTLNGSTGGTANASPSGASLGTQPGRTPTLTIYSDAAPTIAMKAGSITGTVSGTLSGTAPGTVSGGTATTTLQGAPTVRIGGATDPVGTSATISTMPPYLSMTYFIAISGLWPAQN